MLELNSAMTTIMAFLEANENAQFKITITNKGLGPAQQVNVNIVDSIKDPAISFIDNNKTIPLIYPGKSESLVIKIHAGMGLMTAYNTFIISIRERRGFDCDTTRLSLSTLKFQEPKLVLSGFTIVDNENSKDIVVIKPDGKLQAGEMVQVKVVIQNQGQNTSKGTRYSVATTDPVNITIWPPSDTGTLGDLIPGEVKEFWVQVAVNKRVTTKSNLPIFLTLRNEVHHGELIYENLGLQLDQTPRKAETRAIIPDMEKLEKSSPTWKFKPERVTANITNFTDITHPAPSRMTNNDAIGIIIGIEKYMYTTSAHFADNDANIMEEYFKTVLRIPESRIFKFVSSEQTGTSDVSGNFFNNEFNPRYGQLSTMVEKGVTDVFVYYSGHGIPSQDGRNVYFLPSDGHVEGLEEAGFEMGKFYDDLAELGARNTIVILDACFTGVSRGGSILKQDNLLSMKGGVRIKQPSENPWDKDPRLVVLNSSERLTSHLIRSIRLRQGCSPITCVLACRVPPT